MTAPVDYASLQTAVSEWAHRVGDTTYTTYIPVAITMCEALMSARIKSRSMETRATVTLTASNAYASLPTDVIEVRRVYLTSTDPTRQLKYVTPDELVSRYPDATNVDEPAVFTVVGTQLQLAPTPDAAYTVELAYLQRIPALSGTNTTNWVLTTYPNVYLFGTLAQMALFTQDLDKAPQYQALFDAGIKAINDIDWYSGSSMVVRAK